MARISEATILLPPQKYSSSRIENKWLQMIPPRDGTDDTTVPESFPGTVAQETEGPPEITLTSLLVEQIVRLRAGKGPVWGRV